MSKAHPPGLVWPSAKLLDEVRLGVSRWKCGHVYAAVDEQPAPVTDVERRVNDMITDIQSGGVSPPDRTRLRGALDKADADPAGRAAGDAALGRISKRGG